MERAGSWELGFELGDELRRRTLQGKATTLAEQLARLPLVLWSEAENELVRGAETARRRFLDRAALLLAPESAVSEGEHARAWRQKRHLLSSGGGQRGDLAAWNELLAPHLVRRAAVRERLARDLEATVNDLLARLAADLPGVSLRYEPSPAAALVDQAATLRALGEREGEERRRRLLLVGPHRDRLAIALGESGARRFASGGEQKLVGLALVAALASLLGARERAPVVLLDDLESELDPARTELARGLFDGAVQVVATSSRTPSGGARDGARWRLGEGALTPADSES